MTVWPAAAARGLPAAESRPDSPGQPEPNADHRLTMNTLAASRYADADLPADTDRGLIAIPNAELAPPSRWTLPTAKIGPPRPPEPPFNIAQPPAAPPFFAVRRESPALARAGARRHRRRFTMPSFSPAAALTFSHALPHAER